MSKERHQYSFERVIRKFVPITCKRCGYKQGVKNEHGDIKCGMCGGPCNDIMTVEDAVLG